MVVDPYELPEETFENLISLTLECFVQSLNFLNEIGDDMRLVRFIRQAYETYELSVMVDFPHPEWWPDHDMYDEADNLDQEDDASLEASQNDELGAQPTTDDTEDEEPFDTEHMSLRNFIELSVVGTPTSEEPLEDDDSKEPEQVVLASILFPSSYISKITTMSNDQMLSSIELQWLPERNTLED